MVEKLIISQYVGFTMTELAQIVDEVVVKQQTRPAKKTADHFEESSSLAARIR